MTGVVTASVTYSGESAGETSDSPARVSGVRVGKVSCLYSSFVLMDIRLGEGV